VLVVVVGDAFSVIMQMRAASESRIECMYMCLDTEGR